MLNVFEKAQIVKEIIENSDWIITKETYCPTNSIYFEINRNNEWCVIRISDHKMWKKKFLTTYSVDCTPYGLSLDELEELLKKENIGDVLK